MPYTLVEKKSLMNQENAYSKGCEVKYLLKSKLSVDLVEFFFLVRIILHHKLH